MSNKKKKKKGSKSIKQIIEELSNKIDQTFGDDTKL